VIYSQNKAISLSDRSIVKAKTVSLITTTTRRRGITATAIKEAASIPLHHLRQCDTARERLNDGIAKGHRSITPFAKIGFYDLEAQFARVQLPLQSANQTYRIAAQKGYLGRISGKKEDGDLRTSLRSNEGKKDGDDALQQL
jgi:hypothetical protein